MAPWLRAPTLAEEPGSIASTYIKWLKTPGDPTLPSGSLKYLHSSAQTHIKTHIHMIKKYIFLIY